MSDSIPITRSEVVLSNGRILLEYDTVTSTQDIALGMIWAGRRDIAGVRADFQTAGRGRTGASWQAPAGTCLLVTYVIHGKDLHPKDAPQLAFVAAVAVADAIERYTGLTTGFKWPNDILIEDRKIAGILIETARLPDGDWAALVGIGINGNLTAMPPDVAPRSTSSHIETGREISISELEESVRTEIANAFDRYRTSGFRPILGRWLQRDRTPGLRFSAVMNGTAVPCTAVGIGDSGALRVRCDSGEIIEVYSATSLIDVHDENGLGGE